MGVLNCYKVRAMWYNVTIMKRNFFLVLIVLALSCFFAGCASDSKKSKKSETLEAPVSFYDGVAFDDWRYKFFGQELPVWFLYAYEQDFAGVIEVREDCAGFVPEQLYTIAGNAVNGDQAEQFIAQNLETVTDVVLDSFWARLSEEEESQDSYRWLILLKKGE